MAARVHPDPVPRAERWREPTSRLPLRWGGYRERLLLGALLVLGGGVAIAGSNTYALWLLSLGTAASLAGWGVLPAAGWRRAVVLAPATLSAWLLLTGPRFLGVLVVPYLAWLLVRHRPPRSYPTVLFVIAAAVLVARVFGGDDGASPYENMPVALGVCLGVVVLSAWAARALHAAGAPRGTSRGRRPSTAKPQRPGDPAA